MINGDSSAFSSPKEELSDGRILSYAQSGINVRAYIATQAMVALLTRTDGMIYRDEEIAIRACAVAEALLKELT